MKLFVSRLQIIVSLFLADIAGLLSCIYDPTLPQQALLISAKESAQEPLNIVFQDCIKKKVGNPEVGNPDIHQLLNTN